MGGIARFCYDEPHRATIPRLETASDTFNLLKV